jgi:LAO/AO transport system kinase
LGVTGSPGAGKSTLTDRLITRFRERNDRVGVVAIDPTSPFSGGAVLGDRIRMQRHTEDPEVFIRSVATRGALGGLSRSTQDIVVALSAWQAQVVIVETVGVGQDELDVAGMADTTLVVVAPGMGDAVQAIKAGILESADVFAVNKADREGADRAVHELEMMLALGVEVRSVGHHGVARRGAGVQTDESGDVWKPPVVRSVATKGEGIDELVEALDRHRSYLATAPSAAERRSQRLRQLLMHVVRDEVVRVLNDDLAGEVEDLVDRIQRGELDPYTACERLLASRKLG